MLYHAIRGRYRDCLLNPQGTLLWQSNWRSNRILNDCNRLLAALMKGETGLQGLLYWAVGTGQASWDALMPNPQPTTTQLEQEVARFPLAAGQIEYVDEQDHASPTTTPRLAIRLDLEGSALVSRGFQSLREFGVFGGNATAAANSGLMINQAIHPRIDVSPGMTLSRTLVLTFTLSEHLPGGDRTLAEPQAAPPAASDRNLSWTGPRAVLPVSALHGVGKGYASTLEAAGVADLAAMAQLEPNQAIGRLSTAKLREFRAKARLVLSYPTDLGELAPLADLSVAEFLHSPAAAIANMQPSSIALPIVVQWQIQLDSIQLALDDDQLKQMTLGELIGAQASTSGL